MRPRVGIPTLLDASARLRKGRSTHYLDAAYAEALEEAGALAVYLPPGPASPARAAALLEGLDGLLVPGGDDLLPEAPYPEGVRFDPVPAPQLAADRALLRAARARGLPLLGICYGMQLMALEAGGALLYDIPTDAPEAGPHRGREGEPELRHGLRLEPGTRLASILEGVAETEGRPLSVNSRHHQGVRAPGRGLRVAARAEDGLVEAVEAEGALGAAGGPDAPGGEARPGIPFLLGVQWHPESMETPHREALFGAFVSACEAGRRAGGERDARPAGAAAGSG